MAMSKQDFIALADALREHNRVAINRLTHGDHSMTPFMPNQFDSLADFCQQSNSAFKRERWLAYIAGECGPNGGTIKK